MNLKPPSPNPPPSVGAAARTLPLSAGPAHKPAAAFPAAPRGPAAPPRLLPPHPSAACPRLPTGVRLAPLHPHTHIAQRSRAAVVCLPPANAGVVCRLHPFSYVLLFLTCHVRKAANVASSPHHCHRLWSTHPLSTPPLPGANIFPPNLHHAQPKIAISLGESSPKCASKSAPDLHRICTRPAPHLHRICLLPSADCLHPASRQGGDIVD